jgi:phenylacetate-CoA ligase
MTQRQITLIMDLKPEVLCCTPSYAQTLGEEFRKRGIGPEEISLKCGLFGAEPWTERIRADIDASLGLRATNLYGLSEIIGPGVSQECIEERDGSHIWEDHFYPEVVDPQTGQPLPDGETGVLVLTHLTREAMPLLRYWTGDMTYLTHKTCSCGRTHVKMGPIRGRADDMLVIRGANLYPTQIEEILLSLAGVAPHYQLVVTRTGTLDDLELRAEVSERVVQSLTQNEPVGEGTAHDPALRELQAAIQRAIKGSLGLTLRVSLAMPGTIPRSEGGKLKRTVDLREL